MSILGAISTREEYGLRLILGLAKTYYNRQAISLAEIGQSENISVKYLEQIIVPFRQAGWIKSQRGRSGGYIMTKNPKTISLKSVVLALCGKNDSLVPCLSNRCGCPQSFQHKCFSRQAWIKIQKTLEDSLAQINLAELLK